MQRIFAFHDLAERMPRRRAHGAAHVQAAMKKNEAVRLPEQRRQVLRQAWKNFWIVDLRPDESNLTDLVRLHDAMLPLYFPAVHRNEKGKPSGRKSGVRS